MRNFVTLAATLGIGLMATPAVASSDATGSVGVTAFVPEVCDISADDFSMDATGIVTGSVQEFCNTSTGFQVLASHRPLADSEIAAVQYGANTTLLDGSGLAVVAFRSGQRLATVPVSIDARNISSPLAVAFSLSAV